MYLKFLFLLFFLFNLTISKCEARPPGYDSWTFIEGTIFSNVLMYDKAIAKFTEAIEDDDTYRNAYIERAAVYFELGKIDLALKDYTKIKQLTSKSLLPYMHIDFAWITFEEKLDFSCGLLEGMYHGSFEATRDYIPSTLGCLRGILFGLWSFVSAPADVTKEMMGAVYELGEALQHCNCKELAEIFVPEICECAAMWNHWSDATKGQKMGYIIGKYSIYIFMPIAGSKGVQIYRNLKKANALSTLATISDTTKRGKILEEGSKRAAARNNIIQTIKNGKVVPANPNVVHHVMQKKHAWERVVPLTGHKEEDFKRVVSFLEKERLHDPKYRVEIKLEDLTTDQRTKFSVYVHQKIVRKETIEALFEQDSISGVLLLKDAFIRTRS